MADALPSSEERLAESGLLYNLGKSLSAVLDLSELLANVIDAAVTLTRASEGVILLPDPDTGHLTAQTVRSPDDRSARAISQPSDDFLGSYVVSLGQPLLLARGDALPPPMSHRQVDRPVLYTPLISKGRNIGALGVMQQTAGQPFTRRDLDMLAGLGGYAAIAIENARLYTQAIEHSTELSLLVESSNALSWSLDLGRVLNAIARQMTRSLQAHWCIISSWTPDTGAINTLAEYRVAIWPSGKEPRQLVSHRSTLAQALSDGTYRSLSGDDPRLRASGCGRILIVPLQHDGRVVGVVELACLHNTSSHTPAEVRRALTNAFVFSPLIADPDQDKRRSELMDAARTLVSATEASWCTVYRWDAPTGGLDRVLDYGTGVWIDQAGPSLNVAELPTPQVVLREQRIAVLRSTSPDLRPTEAALFGQLGQGAVLLLPLIFKARAVGLVQLFDLDPQREFSSREMGLAHALANQAAISLENAGLVRDLQRSLEQQTAMQSQLVRAARFSAVGEMTMVIAHQINNPLTTILGDAEILVQDTPVDSPLHDSAQAIRRAGERAKQVVERMLNMGRQQSEPTAVDINTTITGTLELVGGQIRQERIDIDLELAAGLPLVSALPGQIEDVWMNLLINARDAIVEARQERGRIAISSKLDAGGLVVEVTVQDNGCGISASDLDRLFDPMFTTKPPGKGTGLGLYICRQIISTHNGQIAVHSSLGKGTRMVVSLPVIA